MTTYYRLKGELDRIIFHSTWEFNDQGDIRLYCPRIKVTKKYPTIKDRKIVLNKGTENESIKIINQVYVKHRIEISPRINNEQFFIGWIHQSQIAKSYPKLPRKLKKKLVKSLQ